MATGRQRRREEAGLPHPAKQVLETYELLEHALLYLPLPELLLAQRVCKKWRDVIVDSDRINKALFKKPIRDQQIKYVTPAFLSPRLPRFGQPAQRPEYDWRTTDEDRRAVVPIANPFLRADLRHGSIQDLLMRVLNRNPSDRWMLREGGSWRQMLIMQPAPASLDYSCMVYMSLRGLEADGRGTAGSRLVDVAVDVRNHLEHCAGCRLNWQLPGHQMFCGTSRAATVPLETSGWEMLALLHCSVENIWSGDACAPADDNE